MHLFKNSFSSLSDICFKLNINMSKAYLHRFIRKHKYKWKSITQKIVLTPIKKNSGIEWVKSNISRDWRKVIFSEEKKYSRGPDTYFKYWNNPKTPNQTINKNKFNRGGIMVYVCVSFNGAISIVEMLEQYDSKEFCSLMEDKILPLIPLYLEDS